MNFYFSLASSFTLSAPLAQLAPDASSGGAVGVAGSFVASFGDALDQTLEMLPHPVLAGLMVALGLVVGSFLNVVVHRLPLMLARAWRADASAPEPLPGHPHPASQPERPDLPANISNQPNAPGAPTPPDPPAPPDDDGLPARYNLWLPRSACPHCGHGLRAWENIPLVSWLALRGRCARCRARIGVRYPLIELASAACALTALAAFGPSGKALAAFGLCAALIAMSAIDFEHQLLPDALTLPLLWAGLAVNLAGTFVSLESAVLGAMGGYLALWCVYWLFRLARGIEGMGYGDFKLLAALGAWLGWAALPQIVAIAALAGAFVGLSATFARRRRFDDPLPFGPYLSAGALVTLFLGTPFYFW